MTEHQVKIMEMAFDPAELEISVGDMVTWTAVQDDHTTTSDSGLWDSRNLQPGASFSRIFDTQGVFPYHCDVSPGPMLGVIKVAGPAPPEPMPPDPTPDPEPHPIA